MRTVRHLIVCEGESERGYIQQLQGFLDRERVPEGAFEPPLRLFSPEYAIARSGRFADLRRCYTRARKQNRNESIQIWADFDLYHRNTHECVTSYKEKPEGLPDFLFSFHNFEDFLALHWDGDRFEAWLRFGGKGHFREPLHEGGYLPEIRAILPEYKKGELPIDFFSWSSLRNLKRNLSCQPTFNPHDLPNPRSFAGFLVDEIGRAYPGLLD